jgi:ferritin-like protein
MPEPISSWNAAFRSRASLPRLETHRALRNDGGSEEFIQQGAVMSSVGYHEPIEELSDQTRDMHRAIVSLMEELEAVDWYNQRADACQDPELKAILQHNRDEEKEHAAMVLEWIRRNDPAMSKELKDYLFTTKDIAHK